jgi:hypothetical protein
MELEILLRDVTKPELNRIYTEPPSSRGGGDMVFFLQGACVPLFFSTLLAEPDSLREQEGLGLAARGR